MVGVAMRGLMCRAAVVAGAAVVLLGPTVGAASAAGGAVEGPARVAVPAQRLGADYSVYVANSAADSVTEYASQATGYAAPAATIHGDPTGLGNPQGLAVDLAGN